MKFRATGRIVLATLASLAVALGITACGSSYTVGFMYITTAQYNQISGFKIDHDSGKLTPVPHSPFAANGTNPVQEVLTSNGRYLYVLNQGSGNITLFAIGGDGVLTYQQTYFSQGGTPVSLAIDSTATHLFVLDNVAPLDPTTHQNAYCPGGLPVCGAITAFTADGNTGRLSLIQNQNLTDPSGNLVTYFPVGDNPTRIVLNNANSLVFTLNHGTAATAGGAAAGSISAYALNDSSGQLTLTQNADQSVPGTNLTAINFSRNGTYLYIIDAGISTTGTSPGTIYPYTVQANGTLQALTGGPTSTGGTANATLVANPDFVISDSTSKFLYVANAGVNGASNGTQPTSSISAFNIDQTNGRLTLMSSSPFPNEAQPVWMAEDPSNQYLYSANFTANTVSGYLINSSRGELQALKKGTSFGTANNPTCVVISSRTS